MGSCLSTIKIMGSNGCNSNAKAPNYAAPKNYYRKEAPKTITNMMGNNQQQRRNNADANAKARLQQGRARRTEAIPCGKKTNFGYAKDFDHKYTIGRLLGHGQFGFTYVATDKLTGDCVAVKKINKNKKLNASFMQRKLHRKWILPCTMVLFVLVVMGHWLRSCGRYRH